MGSPSDFVHVLVIEDSASVAKLVELWLQHGLNIHTCVRHAHTLAAALVQLADEPADVIVLDLHLPDSDGIDTFRTIHARAPELPIVILSGESDEQIALNAVREGAQDYIVKQGGYQVNPLARPVRFALERVRRQRAESKLLETSHQLQLAQSIQEHLFPCDPPRWPGFDIAGRCTAGETVAGDYFDYIPMASGLTGIVIGDVSGHGFSSALLMAAVRAVLRTLAWNHNGSSVRQLDPGDLLTRANENVSPDLNDRFISLLYVSIDPQSRKLRYASAGQPAYLLDAEGNVKAWLDSTGSPLGVNDDRIEASHEMMLVEGDLLVMYTDGITESEGVDGQPFGEERMLNVVRKSRHLPAKQIVDNVFATVEAFSQQAAQHDDMTLVIVKVTSPN